jgi:hypothetical protein
MFHPFSCRIASQKILSNLNGCKAIPAVSRRMSATNPAAGDGIVPTAGQPDRQDQHKCPADLWASLSGKRGSG